MDGNEIEMRFFNETGTKIVLYWIDYNGDYYAFCLLNTKESIKILSNEQNYWFARELESGIFLNFIDRHLKRKHKQLFCSGVDVNNYSYNSNLQCVDIHKCQKTLYEISLLNIIKNGIDVNLYEYQLPKLLTIDIDEVKSFIQQNIKSCIELLECSFI